MLFSLKSTMKLLSWKSGGKRRTFLPFNSLWWSPIALRAFLQYSNCEKLIELCHLIWKALNLSSKLEFNILSFSRLYIAFFATTALISLFVQGGSLWLQVIVLRGMRFSKMSIVVSVKADTVYWRWDWEIFFPSQII